MRRFVICLAGLLFALAFGLVATPPADATSSLWDPFAATSSPYLVCCTPSATVQCNSGYTPISGGYVAVGNEHDVRRLTEYMNFGDGGTYYVTLDDETSFATPTQITASALCLRTSAFSNSVLKTGTFYTGANDIATGTVQCDSGWTAMTGSVDPTGTGGTTLTSTPSNGGTAWTARTWSSDVGSTNYLFVHCVPTSDVPGLKVVTHSDAVGWGTTASASCASGMQPIAGGTYHSGGDSGAISVESRPTSSGWASTTESLSSGSITTTVLCVPHYDPNISITSSTTPAANSNTVQWNWSSSDPAAGSGFTMTTTCQVVHTGPSGLVVDWDWHSCVNPVVLDNRPDGWIQLNVFSQTSDGRERTVSDSILVDTHAPVVTFDDAPGTAYATTAPSIPAHVTDNFALQGLTCAVDDGTATSCGNGTQGAKDLALSGLTEGSHTLHVTATDSKTNHATYDFAFQVDTTAPTVALTSPTAPVTVATTAKVTWTGSDAGAGIGGYATQWQSAKYNAADFGAWSAPVASAGTATYRSFGSLARGTTYCFETRASDTVGNTSDWTTARCTAIPLDDRDLAASGGWTRSAPKGWFNGTSLTATRTGSSLAVTGVTLKRVAVVARKCRTCGVVGVFLGGVRIARIDLHAATSARKLIGLPVFSLRTMTVTLKVLSSGKPVQVDALAVSRS